MMAVLSISIYITYFTVGKLQETPIGNSLNTLPETIGIWKQTGQLTLDDKVVDMLGVDRYVENIYTSPDNRIVDLYVSYFSVLREGKQFHSPKNCLIGSGSVLINTSTVDIPLPQERTSVPVSFMVLQKGDTKQLILYWFQCRGRIMHSEYEERVYRVLDGFNKKRTDGAFVRVIMSCGNTDMKVTQQLLFDFTSKVIPILQQHIPGA